MKFSYLIVFFSFVACKGSEENKQVQDINDGRRIINPDSIGELKITKDPNPALYSLLMVDELPIYGQGKEDLTRFLQENIYYPSEALDSNAQGRIELQFIIENDGRIGDIRCVNEPIGYGLEEEVIRAFKLTAGHWQPATKNGEAVASIMVFPVNFYFVD